MAVRENLAGCACDPRAVLYRTHCPRLLPVLLLVLAARGQVRAPFQHGYSMGNLGTIVWADGVGGRQPWIPAAFLEDSLRFGIALSGVDYYDDMDNLSDRQIRHAVAGGWYRFRYVTVKAVYEHFSALGVYFEQLGSVSVGTSAIPFVAVSLEARGIRTGLYADRDERETLAEFGATLWVPRRYVGLSLTLEHVTVEDASAAGFSVDPLLRFGVHTRRHRIGALGATCELQFEERTRVKFAVGQEYWFHPMFGVCAALSTEPFMVSFGATFVWRRYSTNVSFVHHPVLGWSKGFLVDYAHE